MLVVCRGLELCHWSCGKNTCHDRNFHESADVKLWLQNIVGFRDQIFSFACCILSWLFHPSSQRKLFCSSPRFSKMSHNFTCLPPLPSDLSQTFLAGSIFLLTKFSLRTWCRFLGWRIFFPPFLMQDSGVQNFFPHLMYQVFEVEFFFTHLM